MNAGVFFMGLVAAISVGFYIYTITHSGKKWIKNL